MYKIILTKQAVSDAKKIEKSKLKDKTLGLIKMIEKDPFVYPPEYEMLKGDFAGLISRRINKQHRLVYEVLENDKIVKIYRMWTHYE